MIEITTVSSKGQIVIPLAIREQAEIKKDDKFLVAFDDESGSLMLKKVEEKNVLSAFRSLNKKLAAAAKEAGLTREELNKLIKET